MGTKRRSAEDCQRAIDLYALHGSEHAAATAMGKGRNTFADFLRDARNRGMKPTISPPKPEAPQIDIAASIRSVLTKRSATLSDLMTATGESPDAVLAAIDRLTGDGYNIVREDNTWQIPQSVEPGYVKGPTLDLVSRPDNTFLIGACGDQHIGSKYYREDVCKDYYREYAEAGVQCVFNTGNYIEGDARFNEHDCLVRGLGPQAQLLSELYPKHDFKTFAVSGLDHEGWAGKREGLDVGAYVASVMHKNGRDDWVDIGFMEAHIRLVNANTGKTSILAVVHPGGGSAYALSYSIQKIIESLEGGEKPAVGLYGHYHKLWAGNIRNVWCVQTGTAQDQTTFMRQRRLEAHVGAYLVKLKQDPETGAITRCGADCMRYFNREYYVRAGVANNRWSMSGPVSPIPRSIGGL